MTIPADTPPTKGMMMIAAYRAKRLNRRPLPHESPRRSDTATMAGLFGIAASEALEDAPAVAPLAGLSAANVPTPMEQSSPGAGLADMPGALHHSAAGIDDADQVAELAAPAEALAPVQTDRSDRAFAPPSSGSQSSIAPKPAPASAEPQQIYDPPLAAIGFGPAMLIRLSQLGMHTAADLAHTDAAELREALGEISRLVDVEAWIANARRSSGAMLP